MCASIRSLDPVSAGYAAVYSAQALEQSLTDCASLVAMTCVQSLPPGVPSACGISLSMWRRLLTGWLTDPNLVLRHGLSATQGLRMVLDQFNDDDLRLFVESLVE